MPSNNPCPTCTAASAWGCPVHAPKHMESAAEKGCAPMHAQEVEQLRTRVQELEAETADCRAQMAVCVNAMKALDMVVKGKIDEATAEHIIGSAESELVRASQWLNERDECMKQDMLAKWQAGTTKAAALWREVGPLLWLWFLGHGGQGLPALAQWCADHRTEMREMDKPTPEAL